MLEKKSSVCQCYLDAQSIPLTNHYVAFMWNIWNGLVIELIMLTLQKKQQ